MLEFELFDFSENKGGGGRNDVEILMNFLGNSIILYRSIFTLVLRLTEKLVIFRRVSVSIRPRNVNYLT